LRPAITETARAVLSQRANDIEHSDGCGSLLDRLQFPQSFLAQFLEELVLWRELESIQQTAQPSLCSMSFARWLRLRGCSVIAGRN